MVYFIYFYIFLCEITLLLVARTGSLIGDGGMYWESQTPHSKRAMLTTIESQGQAGLHVALNLKLSALFVIIRQLQFVTITFVESEFKDYFLLVFIG